MTTIEDIAAEHFGRVAGWLCQPEVNRWLTTEWRSQTVSSALVAIAVRNKRNRLFLVRCDGELCGLAGLADIDVDDGTAMVWYFLGDQTLSGRGIISEAVRQVAVRSFTELRLQSLYAWVMEDNAASARVLRKAGFREAGRIRRATCSPSGRVDRVYFDLTADEI